MDSATVKAKRDAARRWANYVTADEKVDVTWRYLPKRTSMTPALRTYIAGLAV